MQDWLLCWRLLGPTKRQSILSLLDEVATAVARAEEEKRRNASAVKSTLPNVFEQSASMSRGRPIADPPFSELNLLDLDPASILQAAEFKSLPMVEKDVQWKSVIVPPSIVQIIGKRGSGKSALGYGLLELLRTRLAPYVVSVPGKTRKQLPDWMGIAPTIEDLPTRCVALIDEAYIAFHSRHSMASESKTMSQILNLSRQRDQTLIFVSQESRQVDLNVASSADMLVFKEPGMLQTEFERPELRRLIKQADEALSSKTRNKKRWSYVYSPDADFLGLLENELPSFWKPGLSKLFAVESTEAIPKRGTSLSPSERVEQARGLRSQGLSYSEIAGRLGVSKSTVVNYLRDYLYRSN